MSEKDWGDEPNEDRGKGMVDVFRHPADGAPVPVPAELAEQWHRPYRCWMRHNAGIPWDLVAMSEGYVDARACKADIERYLETAKSLAVAWNALEMKAIKYQQLEMLRAAVWGQAMKGNLPAAGMAASIIKQESDLLKLAEQRDDEADANARTVIIPADDNYAATLQEVVES